MVLFSDGVIEAFNNNQNLVDFIRSRYVKNKIMD
jgi:serine phosphatase RsbU (regulator of sigma subunit)